MLRTSSLLMLLLLSAVALPSSPVAAGAISTFALPKPQRITLTKPVDCHALATTFISEKEGHVEAETSVGTDHLTIIRSGPTLKVTAHHKVLATGDDVEIYRITSETVDFISAIQAVKVLPVVHGLVINKRLGSAVWNESDSSFLLVSDYPMSTSVFLNCTN